MICMQSWSDSLLHSFRVWVLTKEKAAFSRGTRRAATTPVGPERARCAANQASSRRWLPSFSTVPCVQARPSGFRVLYTSTAPSMTAFRRCRTCTTAGAGAGWCTSLSRVGCCVRFRSPAQRYSALRHGAPSGVATWAATLFSTSSATSLRKATRSGSKWGRCAASSITGWRCMVRAARRALPSGFDHRGPSPGQGFTVDRTKMAVPDFVVLRVCAAQAQRRWPSASVASLRVAMRGTVQLVSEMACTSERRAATSRR